MKSTTSNNQGQISTVRNSGKCVQTINIKQFISGRQQKKLLQKRFYFMTFGTFHHSEFLFVN